MARPSLANSLGQFFGHVTRAIRAKSDSDMRETHTETVSHSVEESTQDTPNGRVTLRRTTIEEIEVEEPRES
ncbi:MAG: hypothetical protein AAGG07_13710 [Planctomycetota bacterium]